MMRYRYGPPNAPRLSQISCAVLLAKLYPIVPKLPVSCIGCSVKDLSYTSYQVGYDILVPLRREGLAK